MLTKGLLVSSTLPGCWPVTALSVLLVIQRDRCWTTITETEKPWGQRRACGRSCCGLDGAMGEGGTASLTTKGQVKGHFKLRTDAEKGSKGEAGSSTSKAWGPVGWGRGELWKGDGCGQQWASCDVSSLNNLLAPKGVPRRIPRKYKCASPTRHRNLQAG